MENNQKWFKLATGMTVVFTAYITIDIIEKVYTRIQKRKRKQNRKSNHSHSNNQSSQKDVLESPKEARIVEGITFEQQNIQDHQLLLDNMQMKSDFVMNRSQKRIQKIVFTGGPCAGKTSAIAYCAELLRDRGFKVLIVPEAASLFNSGGAMINMSKFTEEMIIKFQSALMKMQINLEDRFTEMAMIDHEIQQTVILCDRGVMDGSAYMNALNWQALLDEMSLNTVILRDRRYDAIIHLVTAADGASEFYNLDNPSRYESDLVVAKQVDQNLRNAWHGHPYWILIENKNTNGFDEKLRKTGEAVLHLSGLPSSLVFYKKYLLRNVNETLSALSLIPNQISKEIIKVEDTFLNKTSQQSKRDSRVRRRGQNDSYTYLYFETKMFEKGKLSEVRKRINAKEYISLYQQKDDTRFPLTKTRCVFFYNNENYILEEFYVRDLTFCLLIIQKEDQEQEEQKIQLPDFIQDYIVREVTDLEEYMYSSLSHKDWYMPQDDFEIVKPKLVKKEQQNMVINSSQ